MIGRTTLLWLALATLVVFGLFHVKYQVAMLEEELGRLNAATLREQTQIHVLEAEWSYLNRPSRLEELAERYLDLKPLAPHQLTAISALPIRPTREDASHDSDAIAKILPPRKPPMLARLPASPALSMTAPSFPANAASHPTPPQPAPTTPVGLALEGRR
jgi:cell division protein FtsL